MISHINLFSLLKGQLDDSLSDSIFWFGKITKNQNHCKDLEIHIDSSDCLVSFKEHAKQFNCKSISDIVNLNYTKNPEYAFFAQIPVLISSGCFLWINNKLLLTRRDDKTKFDPLHWTTPAGRCDRLPLQTALKELSEEIMIYDDEKIYMAEQTKPFVSQKSNVQFYHATEKFPRDFSDIQLHTINTYIDGNLVESAKLWYFYNPHVNTLELRLPLVAELPHNIQIKNAEFDQPTHLMTSQELYGLKLVPAVHQLIKEALNV